MKNDNETHFTSENSIFDKFNWPRTYVIATLSLNVFFFFYLFYRYESRLSSRLWLGIADTVLDKVFFCLLPFLVVITAMILFLYTFKRQIFSLLLMSSYLISIFIPVFLAHRQADAIRDQWVSSIENRKRKEFLRFNSEKLLTPALISDKKVIYGTSDRDDRYLLLFTDQHGQGGTINDKLLYGKAEIGDSVQIEYHHTVDRFGDTSAMQVTKIQKLLTNKP